MSPRLRRTARRAGRAAPARRRRASARARTPRLGAVEIAARDRGGHVEPGQRRSRAHPRRGPTPAVVHSRRRSHGERGAASVSSLGRAADQHARDPRVAQLPDRAVEHEVVQVHERRDRPRTGSRRGPARSRSPLGSISTAGSVQIAMPDGGGLRPVGGIAAPVAARARVVGGDPEILEPVADEDHHRVVADLLPARRAARGRSASASSAPRTAARTRAPGSARARARARGRASSRRAASSTVLIGEAHEIRRRRGSAARRRRRRAGCRSAGTSRSRSSTRAGCRRRPPRGARRSR